MKLFHETKIQVYSKKSLKIEILSDVHFSYRVKNKKLNALAKKLRNRKPNYIFISGDLIDSNNMIENPSEEKRLLKWLESLGEIAPTIISKGNHDDYHKNSRAERKQTGEHWGLAKNSTTFIKKVNKLENVHYLDNEIFEDENIYVLGLSLSPKYYRLFHSDRKDKTIPPGENLEQLLKEIDQLDQKLIKNLPKGKQKFALIHSPWHLDNPIVKTKLKEFDFFVSGHMHNGLIIPIVFELWPGDRGIVNASRKVGAKNTRLSSRTLKSGLIITGAVTTWHESVGAFHNLNLLYPSYFTTLEFKNSENLKKKPKVTKRYLNY